MTANKALLDVANLHVKYKAKKKCLHVVQGISFQVKPARILVITGGPHSGKSSTIEAIVKLVNGTKDPLITGSVNFNSETFTGCQKRHPSDALHPCLSILSNKSIQNLSPVIKIGQQISRFLMVHANVPHDKAWLKTLELLDKVHLNDPQEYARQYPFDLPKEYLYRIIIAMQLAFKPTLLIVDDLTCDLGVIAHGQLLALMKQLQKEEAIAIVLITQNLDVSAHMADDIIVMYAGQIIESGSIKQVIDKPAHPYMQVSNHARRIRILPQTEHLPAIDHQPPRLSGSAKGCQFAPFCPYMMMLCKDHSPEIFTLNTRHHARCWLHHPKAPARVKQEYAMMRTIKS